MRKFESDDREKIAAAALPIVESAPAQAEFRARSRSFGNGHRDRPFGSLDLELRARERLPRRERQVRDDVAAVESIGVVRVEPDLEVEVAGFAAIFSGFAEPLQAER